MELFLLGVFTVRKTINKMENHDHTSGITTSVDVGYNS